jgi:hypothetical protein
MNSRSRWITSLVVVLGLACGLVRSISADPGGGHWRNKSGLEGTWRIKLSPKNCQTGQPLPPFEALLSVAEGGTLTDLLNAQSFFPGQRTPGLGVWNHTHGRNYRSVSEAFILSDSPATPPGLKRGVQRLTWNIQVDDDMLSLESAGELLDANGVLQAATCASGMGIRMELQED